MPLDTHLVVHLQEMYATERDYGDFLTAKSDRVSNTHLKTMINHQVDEINGQMANLQRAMSELNASPQDNLKSPIVRALQLEDTQTMQSMPNMTPADMDVHLAVTDISFGQMEIGIYTSMIAMADALGKKNVSSILQQNLQQEQDGVQQAQSLLHDLLGSQQQRAA